jgi:hypothetical protein
LRLGVIADVHADVHALRDALGQMDRLACDAIVCAGDLVDYGLYAEIHVMPSGEACRRGARLTSVGAVPHNQTRFLVGVREAMSASGARNRPRRSEAGTTASIASSFSLGSART